jgi:hypothetical protein
MVSASAGEMSDMWRCLTSTGGRSVRNPLLYDDGGSLPLSETAAAEGPQRWTALDRVERDTKN